MAAAVVIACAHTHSNAPTPSGTAGFSPVREPECYSLSYRDSSAGASSRLFPTWIEIFPGSDSGAAMGAFALFADPAGNEFGLYEEPRPK